MIIITKEEFETLKDSAENNVKLQKELENVLHYEYLVGRYYDPMDGIDNYFPEITKVCTQVRRNRDLVKVYRHAESLAHKEGNTRKASRFRDLWQAHKDAIDAIFEDISDYMFK